MKPTPETDIPTSVIEATLAITTWASMNGLSEFEINGICDRKRIYKLERERDEAHGDYDKCAESLENVTIERDQLRKVADELAKQLENHVSICGGREHHKDNCEAPEYPCHDCELNDAIDIALKNHNQLPHVKERNEK